MANSIVQVLQAVIGNNWMDKMIGISTDGAASMVGRVSGAVTRIERYLKPSVYRVWCGALQLDLAFQNAFEVSLRRTFHPILHSLIAYLRRPVNFKSSIGSFCPKEATTRWLPMGLVCRWIIGHRHDVQSYLREKDPSASPSVSWWL